MLFGVKVEDVTFSSKSKGFFAVCCACGVSNYVNIRSPMVGCVIIECKNKECGQEVSIVDGEAEITVESKHVG